MVADRDKVRAARAVANKDIPGLPPLYVGDLVVGQLPQTEEWSLDEEVTEVTHGKKAYIVTCHDRHLKLDKNREVWVYCC